MKRSIGYFLFALVLIFPFRWTYLSDLRPSLEVLIYFLLTVSGVGIAAFLISGGSGRKKGLKNNFGYKD